MLYQLEIKNLFSTAGKIFETFFIFSPMCMFKFIPNYNPIDIVVKSTVLLTNL